MDVKAMKESGKQAFKANYWRCVLVAFLISLLTIGTTASAGKNANDARNEQAEQDVANALLALSPDQLAALVGAVVGGFLVICLVSFLLKVFLFNPLQVGGYRFFRKNAKETGVPAGVVKEGFGGYGHTFVTLFLRDFFLALWSLLFVIPGIVKSYSYMLVPYLIKDQPELSATEAIRRSRELMNGHKMEAFLLDLSFIGWYLLGVITFDLVNIFWTEPYRQCSRARFYLKLIGE